MTQNRDQPRLFKQKLASAEPGTDQLFKIEYDAGQAGPVECHGSRVTGHESRVKNGNSPKRS
jgi:hypothetical protein